MTSKAFYKQERIIYLLSKRLQQPLSIEEEEEIVVWRQTSQANQLLFEQLNDPSKVSSWLAKMKAYDLEASMDRIKRRMVVNSKRQKQRTVYWMAASILIFLCMGGLFMYEKNHKEVKQMIPPGRPIAQLKLHDGSTVDLDRLSAGESTSRAGVRITKTADGQITCNYTTVSGRKPVANYNTIATPIGGEYRVVLPDGSLVWLNANSSLAFPSQFTERKRNVRLTGEAYFEIVHDVGRPFIVNTRQQTIYVLGTKFNVQAYQDELAMKTTLLEGAVQVRTAHQQQVLKVGEEARSYVADDRLDIERADIEAALAWKNGYFVFNDENIVDIMKKIGRWYQIDVTYVGDMEDKIFAGTFSKRKSLQHLLSSLAATGEITYEIKGRRVTIMSE